MYYVNNDKINLVHEQFKSNESNLLICYDYLKDILDPNSDIDRVFLDVIYQYHNKESDLYDAFYFAYIFTLLENSTIVYYKVPVNSVAYPNACIKENNDILIKSLDKHEITINGKTFKKYNAEFIPENGRSADDDGFFRWNLKTFFELRKGVNYDIAIKPNRIPLEVGYTDSFTTYKHLSLNGGVARWPYDSSDIHVLINWTHPFIDGSVATKSIDCKIYR